jgi:predicted nuclease of predicted toxin-antitoxin system
MRFYLDENVSAPNADYLKHRHNVRHAVIDYGHQGRDDRFHHQQAKWERRILITLDEDFAQHRYSANRHPGVIIIRTGRKRDYHKINAILDQVLRRFRTAADFYEAKIIASTTGWRRISREGEERGEWEVAVREERNEYNTVEAVEVGSS